jgi:MFS family permease
MMRFPALKNRHFVIYTAGNASAMVALWINRVIIGWLGWELTGLASWVGILSFFLFAPTIVASPLFGVLLDRIDPRRAAVASQTVLTATVTLLLVLQLSGVLNIWLLGTVALIIGITSSADRTIRFVLVPRIVERDALPNAVAIHGINFNTARLIGPAVGGLLIDAYGTDVATLVNAVMITPFVVVLLIVRFRDRDEPKPQRKRFFREMLDGARHAVSHPIIREAMMLSGVLSLTARGVLEILPAIADGEFQRGAQGLGQMLTAAGAGALLAAFSIAVRRSGTPESGVTWAARASIGGALVATIILGLTSSWIVAMAMVFALGFFLTNNGIDLQASIQIELTDTFRARVMSLWIVLVIGGAAVSAITLGFFADLTNMSATLIGAGIAGTALVAAASLAIARSGAKPPST